LDGEIKVNATGTSKDLNPGGNTLWGDGDNPGDGSYVFDAGARAYVGGGTAKDLLIGGVGDPSETTWIQLASGKFSNTKDAFVLAGVATLRTSFGLNSGQTLTIKDNGKLTVEMMSDLGNPQHSPSVYLTVYPGCKIIGEGNAVIEAKAPVGKDILNGNIYFFGNNGDSTNANFYNSAGELLPTSTHDEHSGATMVPYGTYTWTGTGETVGWKASKLTLAVKFNYDGILDLDDLTADSSGVWTIPDEKGLTLKTDTYDDVDDIKWYVDVNANSAAPTGTGAEFTLNKAGLRASKKHSLTVIAKKGGIPYSQTVTFTFAVGE
jgi:hypothetical protein